MRSEHLTRLGATVAVISLVLAGVAGCGGGTEQDQHKRAEETAEKALESATDSDVDVDLDNGEVDVEFKTDDGTYGTQTATTLPPEWPGDVPIPGDMTLQRSTRNTMGNNDSLSVTGLAPMSHDDAVAFFTGSLNGWRETQRNEFAPGNKRTTILGFEKDGREVSVTVREADGGQTITVAHVASK